MRLAPDLRRLEDRLAFLEEFVAHRRALRSSIAQAIRHALPDADRQLLPTDELAILALALSNGLAIETLADPAGVPDGIFGRALTKLVND